MTALERAVRPQAFDELLAAIAYSLNILDESRRDMAHYRRVAGKIIRLIGEQGYVILPKA